MKVSVPTADQGAQFQAWRAEALEKMPYFASLLFSLRVLNAPGLGTWAVDGGHRLYIDFDAVASRGNRWNVESVLHECSHLFAEHKQSAQDLAVPDQDREIWNAACDFSINDDLDEAGCTTFRTDQMLPEFIAEPNGQTPHHYYAVLKQKMQPPPQRSDSTGQAGSGQPDTGATQGAGQPQPYRGCGSGSGGKAWSGELDEADDLGGTAPAASDVEREAVRLAVAAAVIDHAAKGRGTVPGGLLGHAEKLLAPSKTPWQQVLGSMIRRAVAAKTGTFDADHTRRSRRRRNVTVGARRAIFPGYQTPIPSVELIRDTSGSMSEDDLAVVGREVEAIAKKIGIRGKELRVTDVDTEVHPSVPYTGAVSIREVKGRGGTDMAKGIETIWEAKRRPTVIVVATDGMTGWPEAKGPVPVVACIIPQEGYEERAEYVAERAPAWIKTLIVEPAG